MKEAEVKAELLRMNLKWEDFMEWMRGRTYSKDANGNDVYHKHDVDAFITEKYTGVVDPDWD